MSFCASLDRTKLCQLIANMGGIYIMYFMAGLLHQSVFKHPYPNWVTGKSEKCQDSIGLLFLPFLIAWWMAAIYNRLFITDPVVIPRKNSIITASLIVLASAFSLFAIQRTSFPVVVMFESCSIVPVVLIGVFCSRVRDKTLKLGPKKIIVTVIIVVGILLFELFDPETWKREVKQEFIGIFFLLFHFVAEGFLPDLQAEIKVQYKPQPTEMMGELNKWASIMSLILLIPTLQIYTFPIFMFQHPRFTFDLVISSILAGFGQFFVYRMIKQFKQHFVPFTISSRKILTVVISIVFYQHETNGVQILGVIIVLSAVAFQFLSEIRVKPARTDSDVQLNEEIPEQKPKQENMEENFDKFLNDDAESPQKMENKKMENNNVEDMGNNDFATPSQ